MTTEDQEPDAWEVRYYMLSAYQVIETLIQQGMLTGPLDPVTPKGHQRLLSAYGRGWRPRRDWLFRSIMTILEGNSQEQWPSEHRDGLKTYVDNYLQEKFPNPQEN